MAKRNALQHAIRGCGHVPGYGDHPGTVVLVLLVLMGFGAGLERGIDRALVGAALMLGVFGPMYLWGAYDRSRSADRSSKP